MYYSTTSILPSLPNKKNNVKVKFADALIKKLAKEQIKRNTKKAANKITKRSVTVTTKRGNNAVQQIGNRYNANKPNHYTVLPLYSTNLFMKNRKTRSQKTIPKTAPKTATKTAPKLRNSHLKKTNTKRQ